MSRQVAEQDDSNEYEAVDDTTITTRRRTHHHVREHSYLPGTMNPLFPTSLLQQRQFQQQQHDNELTELAIMELNDVVLFPGNMTLPLRLKESAWIAHLGEKIEESKRHANTQVRIGIVTRERMVDRRRSSTLRMAFRRQDSGALLLQLGESNDDEDDDDDGVVSDEENESSVEYHELMDEDEGSEHEADVHEPIASTSESDVGQRAAAQVMVAEEVNRDEHDDEESHQQEDPKRELSQHEIPNSITYNVELIEENLDRIDQALNDAQETVDRVTPSHRMDHQHLLDISQRLDRAETAQQPILEAFDTILDLIRSGAPLTSPSIAQVLREARRHRVRVAQQLDRMQSIHFRLERLNSQTESTDPLIGRIGTVAIVSYTFDETPEDALGVSNADGDRDELVVTVVGTNRFEIVSRVGENDGDASNRQQRLFGELYDSSEVRKYMVRELPNTELPLLPTYLQPRRPLRQSDESDQLLNDKLSKVSSVPQLALQSVWPWRLVERIQSTIDGASTFDGLQKNLRKDLPLLLQPTAFSFWMTSNLSLSQDEKLMLLQMPTTVERLRYILHHVLKEREKETYVCCKTCHARLSSSSGMFAVGGAEGTSGAYVNEYGIVHQTITLRNADESMLAFSGGPETRDSWFPGYSWTITYCQQCHSHLGWKFHLVGATTSATEDRPDHFYGWSASSVTFSSS